MMKNLYACLQLRQRTNYVLPAFLFILLFATSNTGCKKAFDDYYSNKSPKGGYLYDKIKADSNFSVFTKGLERAGLVQFIDKGGLYTVFAPTNNAFSKFLSANGYASIDNVPVDRLFTILSFHIVNNLWYYYDLNVRYKTYRQTLYLTRNKKFLNIDVTSVDTIKVNGFTVIKNLRDIDADNGVIHGIGDVLVPLPNLEQLLQSDPQLANSTFYKLMQVVADSTFDRFNSYDIDRDGRIDSIFYKTYPFLDNVNTSIEFRQNTAPENQGGDPVFTTILMPTDDSLNALIAPALAQIPGTVTNKIAALSPSYVEAMLESYFVYDTVTGIKDTRLMQATPILRSVNQEIVPAITASQFIRTNIPASNGIIHVINRTFPRSDRMRSAIGMATIDPELYTYFAAVQKAGLMGSISVAARIGTYFAPTNAAFQSIGLEILRAPQVATLNGVSLTATQFSNIMRNHIVNLNLPVASLTGTVNTDYANTNTLTFATVGANRTVMTVLGLTANITLPVVSVGPGNVGYVYKVDKVLLPRQQ